MDSMIIRPHGTPEQQIPYAAGRFADGDAFAINQIGATSPFGGILCSLGSDYAVEVLPDGSGSSWYAGTEITSSARLGKAWYIRDKESGELWSAFFSPMGERSDEYEVSYQPGQASVFCLKNKIASTLTIATVPNVPCEIWSVKLENRAATSRTLEFTTYIEPAVGTAMESIFREKEKVLLMRRPLGVDDAQSAERHSGDMVLFHSSTLTPSRFAVEKTDFIGDGRSLQDPVYLENTDLTGESGCVSNPIAALTIEIELPIEGEAEFGFCFGIAPNPEVALRAAHALKSQASIQNAVEGSLRNWGDIFAGVHVDTSDSVFDALVNKWLPYETYSGWIRERNAPTYLDPARMADVLRCLYPLSTSAFDAIRESLLSFAAGLSLLGSYSPDRKSLVSIPPPELLWLAISTARYIAETGDKGILAESIALRDGPAMPLREHCERIIRMCLNNEQPGSGDDRLLCQTIKLWSLVCDDSDEFSGSLQAIERRISERGGHSERRALPRRVRYLQSITPTLADKAVLDDLLDYLGSDEMGVGDVDATCTLYSALVEWTLGLNATYEGLSLNPKLPDSWFECDITRRFRGDTYNISIRRNAAQPGSSPSIVVDGEPVLGQMLPYFGDGKEHRVEVTVG